MPTTKYKIAEQVLRLHKGGDQKMASNTDIREVIELVGQVCNGLLKAAHFSETMSQGERIPVGLMLATYENIVVTQYAGRSRATLPATPIHLPRNVGVFSVVPYINDVPRFDCELIPVPPGQWWMIQKEGLIADLMGMYGYEVYGTELLFTKDLTTQVAPITKVLLRLAIMDVSKLSDTDLLPIPADMEEQLIVRTYEILSGKRPKSNINDPVAEQPVQ